MRYGTWLALAAALSLGACDRIDAWRHPYDEKAVLHAVPAPPGGSLALFPDAKDGVKLESRPGACDVKSCLVFVRGRWKPLQATTDSPLLSVGDAIGTAFDDTLWQPATGPGVIVNREAGKANLSASQPDGLRIGLKQGNGTGFSFGYYVVYSVETKAFLAAHGRCGASGQDCGLALGNGLYLNMPEADVYVRGDKAWLLQQRADGSVNLIDLFAAAETTDPDLCGPGFIGVSRPTSDYKTALSPDIFVSRTVAPMAADRLAGLAKVCAADQASASKGTP